MRRLLALVVVAGALAGCADRREAYCEAVAEHQKELTEIAASDEPGAALDALAVYRDLRDQAPTDISDEWQQVVTSLERLEAALEDAGVEPGEFDPEKPPEGVSEEEQAEIAAAATEVGSAETTVAMEGLQQQALDVCKTPLSR